MPFTTLPPAGAKLPASTLFSAINELRPITGRKTASESRASTIVEVADSEIRVALPINTTWEFWLILMLESLANAAGDFSGHLEYPAGAITEFGNLGLDLALPSGLFADLRSTNFINAASPLGSFQVGCSTSQTTAYGFGRIVMGATAGELALFWAQQNSNVNATRVRVGSRLTARMIG